MAAVEDKRELNAEQIKKSVADISQGINNLSGTFSPYTIFSDWVKMYALAICNMLEPMKGALWEVREKAYMATASKYTSEQLKSFAELSGRLVELYDIAGPYDALGEIYMFSGCGNKGTGQFFTPFHLSKLVADVALKNIKNGEKIRINEPSCGGGGMILAAARLINESGGDARMQMDIVAQDLDWNSIYMTYIQLSLNGLNAVCIQGDSLMMCSSVPRECVLETPRKRGVLL